MIGKLGDALEFQSKALLTRATRQATLASNVANADTPGYKARDIDFAKILQEATASTQATAATKAASAPAVTHVAHMKGTQPAAVGGEPVETESAQSSQDGNTVDIDAERSRFADNALRYEAALRQLGAQLRMLNSAISG